MCHTIDDGTTCRFWKYERVRMIRSNQLFIIPFFFSLQCWLTEGQHSHDEIFSIPIGYSIARLYSIHPWLERDSYLAIILWLDNSTRNSSIRPFSATYSKSAKWKEAMFTLHVRIKNSGYCQFLGGSQMLQKRRIRVATLNNETWFNLHANIIIFEPFHDTFEPTFHSSL